MANFAARVKAALTAWKQGFAGNRFVVPPSRQPQSRSYAGAQYDRLTEDWMSPLTTGDAEMKIRLRILRGRARELERNEPYTRRFLSRLCDNVYDHHGIAFSSLAGSFFTDPKTKKPTFQLDASDSWVIEQAYNEWKKNPCVTGDMSLNEAGRLQLRTTARDGDPIVRYVVDKNINKFGFAIQLLEPDMIDDYKNEIIRAKDNTIEAQVRMGVEVNQYFAPQAYWILQSHPGDQQWWTTMGYISNRFPASEFCHTFYRTRITQVRDVTWLCGIMRDLKMLDGYDEAAIVAARVGAAKMGFFTRDYNAAGESYAGDQKSDPALGGNKAMDAEPGLIEDLSQNPGLKFQSWDPAYPHDQYGEFVKTRLRRIGAGLDMSYYAIANDLTDVNFSSIRAGLLEDREHFKSLQTWWINRFETPIFRKWLEISLLNGTLRDPRTSVPLPFSKIEKFKSHRFRPRRWPWVDPEKDAQAAAIAVDNRFKSRNEVIQETSQHSFAEVMEEQAREQELAESLGIELPPASRADKQKPEAPTEDTSEPANGSKSQGKGKDDGRGTNLEPRMSSKTSKATDDMDTGTMRMHMDIPMPKLSPVFNVQMPEMRQAEPPVVNIHVPKAERELPPVINVHVPATPAPQVTVNLPKRTGKLRIEKDANGKTIGAEIV